MKFMEILVVMAKCLYKFISRQAGCCLPQMQYPIMHISSKSVLLIQSFSNWVYFMIEMSYWPNENVTRQPRGITQCSR